MPDAMIQKQYKVRVQVRDVTGPDGKPWTVDDLPPADLLCRSAVVLAVCDGLLTLDEACKRYNLTIDDFLNCYREIQRLEDLPADQIISVSLSRGRNSGPPHTVRLR